MDKRFWYPFTFKARNARIYRVSFLIAEEATWDHRFLISTAASSMPRSSI